MHLIARTGQIDIHSNEGKRPLMNPPVGSTEDALHESHIRIDERKSIYRAGFCIRLRHHAADVCQADKRVQVRDCAWFGIYRIDRCRTEDMVGPTENR
jgi:hypothetical protein